MDGGLAFGTIAHVAAFCTSAWNCHLSDGPRSQRGRGKEPGAESRSPPPMTRLDPAADANGFTVAMGSLRVDSPRALFAT